MLGLLQFHVESNRLAFFKQELGLEFLHVKLFEKVKHSQIDERRVVFPFLVIAFF